MKVDLIGIISFLGYLEKAQFHVRIAKRTDQWNMQWQTTPGSALMIGIGLDRSSVIHHGIGKLETPPSDLLPSL